MEWYDADIEQEVDGVVYNAKVRFYYRYYNNGVEQFDNRMAADLSEVCILESEPWDDRIEQYVNENSWKLFELYFY